MDDALSLANLGPGWDGAKRALAELQADLSRTVEDAPRLVLLWRDANDDDWPPAADLDGRWAYIGKAPDWYYGAEGGFELPRDYATALPEIADELSAAIVDSLLGARTYWPRCPDDGGLLQIQSTADGHFWWVCQYDDRPIAEVGQLPRTASGRG